MTLIKRISLPVLVMWIISACNPNSSSDSTTVGNWITRSSFEGVARSEAVAFTIGDFSYLGSGFDGKDRLKDFWQYDPVQNFWLQKADVPGAARSSAVGMSINDKGYIGTGYDNDGGKLKDFWQYDPTLNTWKAVADFGGSARYDAVAFSIKDKDYVTTGFDGNYLKDLWQYDPVANAWTQLPSYGGDKRREAVAFVINDKAYVCTGINNGTAINDMWMFDPQSGWTEKRKLTNVSDSSFDDAYTSIVRSNAVSIVINGKAYISTGENGSSTSGCWEYDPAVDLWVLKTSFERSGRSGAVGFSVKGKGFVSTGRSGSNPFDDLEEFYPDQAYQAND